MAESFYLKNPIHTNLGNRIVSEGLRLLNEKGYTNFTFKELATNINSVEASVYRYFDSKDQFLAFCCGVYWSLLKARLDMYTLNVQDRAQFFERTIDVLLNELRDTQYKNIAYRDFYKFRQAATRYSHFLLGLLTDDEKRITLLNDYETVMGEVYLFIRTTLVQLNNDLEFPELLADDILYTTLPSRSKAQFIDRLYDEDTVSHVRQFLRQLVGLG